MDSTPPPRPRPAGRPPGAGRRPRGGAGAHGLTFARPLRSAERTRAYNPRRFLARTDRIKLIKKKPESITIRFYKTNSRFRPCSSVYPLESTDTGLLANSKILMCGGTEDM